MGLDYRDTPAWQRIAQTSIATDPTGPVMLVDANPQRVGLIMCCPDPAPVFLSPMPFPAGSVQGMWVDGHQGPVILDHAHHGLLVQSAWYAIEAQGTVPVTAIELIMDRDPDEAIRSQAHEVRPVGLRLPAAS